MFYAVLVNFFAAGGIAFAFEHSNFAGKLILLSLGILSLFSWSVIVMKIIQIRRAKKATDQFLRKFRSSRKPLSLYQNRTAYIDSPAFAVYHAGCKELTYHMLGSDELDETFSARLAEADSISETAMTGVQSTLERVVGEQALLLEDKMIWLATAVSGAPFLGLLGTVWGVMDTFSDIAMAGRADLASMAPGVSGALITTVTGLLVAIPAMFGYNFLVTTVRAMTVELDNFASELASSLAHRYLNNQ